MPLGDKGLIATVISALAGAEHGAGQTARSAADSLGERLFGSTAESETGNAEVIKPQDASIEPTTVGRRSKGPDGNDSFHSSSTESEGKA